MTPFQQAFVHSTSRKMSLIIAQSGFMGYILKMNLTVNRLIVPIQSNIKIKINRIALSLL